MLVSQWSYIPLPSLIIVIARVFEGISASRNAFVLYSDMECVLQKQVGSVGMLFL